MTAIKSISKNMNLSISSELFYILMREISIMQKIWFRFVSPKCCLEIPQTSCILMRALVSCVVPAGH